MGWPKEAFVNLRQILTPKSRPAPGGNLLYTKADNNLYLLDADGTEHQIGGGGSGVVESVVAGDQITVDDTDPANPIIATIGLLESVVAGTNITIDATDPANPIISSLGGMTDPTTTLGDLLVNDGSGLDRLPVGADGQILYADSGEPLGMKWDAAPSGGGGGSVLLLEPTLTPAADVPGGTDTGTVVYMKSGTPGTPLFWDFRGLSALPTGWQRRGISSETFDAAGVSATYGVGEGHYYTLSTPAATGTLEVKMVTGPISGVALGPIVFGASSVGGASAWNTGPSGCLALLVNSSHQYGGSFANAGGTPAYPAWFRVRYESTAGVSMRTYSSYSFDGTTWSAEAVVPVAQAVQNATEIGFGNILSASATAKVEYAQWSTPVKGGLLGWWDGSTIVAF